MKDLPVVVKVVINIILYIAYVLFASVVFSFMFPLVMQILGQGVINPDYNMNLYDKIAVFLAVLVLLITLILRKHFYMSIGNNEDEYIVEEVITKKKAVTPKKQTKKEIVDEDDEDIKIYVEKEIK